MLATMGGSHNPGVFHPHFNRVPDFPVGPQQPFHMGAPGPDQPMCLSGEPSDCSFPPSGSLRHQDLPPLPVLPAPPVMSPSNNFSDRGVSLCCGCGQPIEDKYLLCVQQDTWHEGCLRCCVCRYPLDTVCYTRQNNMYCKHDYDRLFAPKCGTCLHPILPADLAMRAGGRFYHTSCFVCNACGTALRKGDQFVVKDGFLLCRLDYERELMYFSPMSPRSDSDSSLEDDGEHGSKAKRPRTILTTSQRRKFKQAFESNPKPCRKVREALAAETGLSVRVVQVWFQNQRAKVKKIARRQSQSSDQEKGGKKKIKDEDNSDDEGQSGNEGSMKDTDITSRSSTTTTKDCEENMQEDNDLFSSESTSTLSIIQSDDRSADSALKPLRDHAETGTPTSGENQTNPIDSLYSMQSSYFSQNE